MGLVSYRLPTKLQEGNIFSRICHSAQVAGGPHVTITMMHWTSLYRLPGPGPLLDIRYMAPSPVPSTSDIDPPGPGPLLMTSGGHHWRPVQTCSLEDPPTGTDIKLRHQSMYSWQAGSTHPPGMLSCILSVSHGQNFDKLTLEP